MQTQRVELSSLVPDPDNARKHPDRNLKVIKDSLNKFGQQHPLIVSSDNVIIAGNGRYEAMRQMGWTHCDIVRTGLSGADARAFSIADNRASDTAAWDDALLVEQLQAIAAGGQDMLTAAGYEHDELRALLERSPEAAAELGRGVGSVNEFKSGFPRSFEDYTDSQVKMLVMTFAMSQYTLIVDAMADIAEQNGLETNSDVLIYLLEKAGHAVTERIEEGS
jgi:hypothetical protein